MAENRLSWTELRKALATRSGVSEKTAKVFLEVLNAQIIEGLKEDKQVRINGIGTFRLQPIAPRRSVNVTTGESITIEGYDKIVLTPEAGVKELIEHNTSMKKKNAKQPAEEPSPLKKLGEQAEEIVDILADLGQEPVKATEKKPKPKTRSKKAAVEKAESVVIPEPEQPSEQEPAAAPSAPVASEEPKAAPEVTDKKKYHFLRDTLICVVVLLMLLLAGYFFLRHQFAECINALKEKETVSEQVVVPETPVAVEEEAVAEVPQEIIYDQLITTERMHKASRLAWMAWRYYGNKDFWVYLYDANKDHIVNPDKITVGTPIRVPQLTSEQMDTTLESTKAVMERLRAQGEEAKMR